MLGYKTICVLAVFLGVQGCVVAGPTIEQTLSLDQTVTGSIATPPTKADTVTESDRMIVRNAVSSADIASGSRRFAWSNPETGSSGVISDLNQFRDGENICRNFETSRQRFDGIALYRGRACTAGAGQWALLEFAKS
ncbi:hypothetical protein LQ948_09205 [Jiella sp. MQZ9-1]|uniref:Surface antigen domain-containing protein n=1 Tax=Jiella flava TaxID=2816857 RepID=A0A939JU64_9HYPH|nr:RT0821/Lpp0805 family surface protein [Jiella flava]MBO0662855.1 hypothetical protein [Jiella flava]MCD2471385.1 hypothetical protein [Jiella flava]